jgi:hypothetical protein
VVEFALHKGNTAVLGTTEGSAIVVVNISGAAVGRAHFERENNNGICVGTSIGCANDGITICENQVKHEEHCLGNPRVSEGTIYNANQTVRLARLKMEDPILRTSVKCSVGNE